MSTPRPVLVRPVLSEINLDSLAIAGARMLQQFYRQVFDSDVPAGNAEHARRKIAWHLQATRGGSLPESARQQALAIARNCVRSVRSKRRIHDGPSVSSRLPTDHDSRIPMPGSVIIKQHKGRRILVRVLASGFEYEGRAFATLSALARDITGTNWNGLAFFGLTKGASYGSQK
ncbi:MAG: DUF2924 domain-containing protein [Acidobacteriota bacterium]